MQKAGEPENDAGFLKHIASEIAVIPTPLSLYYWLQFFKLHIYCLSKWFLTKLTHAHTATAHVSPHVHSTCTSYVVYAYLVCIAYMR